MRQEFPESIFGVSTASRTYVVCSFSGSQSRDEIELQIEVGDGLLITFGFFMH